MYTSSIESRTRKFISDAGSISFRTDCFVYNPLTYAYDVFRRYEEMAMGGENRVMFIGMNPGPDGMMQLGVPFGSVSMVRGYLGLDGMIGKPAQEHEKKKILGFAVRKDEPSGRAFWSMVRKAFPDRNDFFSFASVQNFCPLAFLKNESGANITPDRLMKEDREALEALCLDYLGYLLDAMDVKTVVAIGNYVEKMVKKLDFPHIVKIMHPSPVNPKAHEVWADEGASVIEYLKKERVF